jgi:tRNA nucleotidyltransferase (CCA-adding enzyme)
MEVVTTHINTDFDGLAAMAAASRLYPGARLALPGGADRNVKHFLSLHGDLLDVETSKDLPRSGIRHVILVDTQMRSRMGELADLLDLPGIRVTIYDHHPAEQADFSPDERHVEPLGATTTLLLRFLRERNLTLSPFEATLFALGIYMDTGSFTFAGTTAEDLEAAAFLRRSGANLDVVAEYLHYGFTDAQRALLGDLIRSSETHMIRGVAVSVACVRTAGYVGEAAAMASKLMELENAEAVFLLAQMDDDLYLIGRSQSDRLDVAEALKEWGGGGHPRAASAHLRLPDPGETKADGAPTGINAVKTRLLQALEDRMREEPKAGEIMSRPARTVSADANVEEAAAAMQRYGHSGLSVVENGKLVGVISRRDVDKARHHRLLHAPVKGFMARGLTTASPEDSLSALESRMIENDVGRLPVLENGRLVGVVTRGDLLRARHGARYAGARRNLSSRLEASVPASLLAALRKIGEEGDERGVPVYLVGGFVRDLLIGTPLAGGPAYRASSDLDLVTEGDALSLAGRLAAGLNAVAKTHPRFGTASLIFPDGSHLDLATARTESYARPAALPDVERSSIEDDLRRRDFTINAMAIRLGTRHFGELLDPYKGARDLRRREIRILHNLSFVEDPTRLMRAVRFEARFGFRMEPHTLELFREAIREGRLSSLTPERFRKEALLSLEEPHPLVVVRRWRELGILEHLSPGLQPDEALIQNTLDALQWFASLRQRESADRALLLLAALLSPLPPGAAARVCREKLRLSEPKAEKIERCLERSAEAARLALELNPAERTRRLNAETLETIVFAAARSPEARDPLGAYLQKLRHVKLGVTGNDLIRLGYRPGPEFREAMQEALDRKLLGKLRTRKRELEFLQERLDAFKKANGE